MSGWREFGRSGRPPRTATCWWREFRALAPAVPPIAPAGTVELQRVRASSLMRAELHSAQSLPPERRPTMPAKIVHVEVVGKDGSALQRFYADVFGWKLDTDNPGGYGMHPQGDLSAGIGPAREGEPGHVTFYVHADDAEAALRR